MWERLTKGNLRMKFKAFYDSDRYEYLSDELKKQFKLKVKNKTVLKKTACFFGDKFNFFIDTSDGINEDLDKKEYCGKIIRIVQDYNNKPFLYFKTSFSATYSSNIVKIAEQHNGKVLGCYVWTFRPKFYDYILPNIDELRREANNSSKQYDLGFMGELEPYKHPKPNATNPLVSCEDNRPYGLGSPVHTGYDEFNPRKTLFNKMKNDFNVFRGNGYSFEDYIKESFKWKLCFNAPGYGEFTARAFIHSAIGQPVVFRKNTFDNPVSWKDYWPEIDFNSNNWVEELSNIISNYKEWAEKSLYYYSNYLTPQNMVKYLYDEVSKFESEL